ncbi:MAG TPA: PSD1 and planctomycete cytochrome C domain-containing protein [Isosphaeraceae bacterium]|jgi:mono/diheme cytochrome c family protein
MCMISVFLLGLALPAGAPDADRPVDYLRDVKPVLAAHCVACHGAEKPRGGLRLETAAAARRGGSTGEVIVPGRPEESLLYQAVIGAGDSERMPLRRPPLADAQVEALRAWIARGAPAPADEVPSVAVAPKPWAFVAPERPGLPAVQDDAWVRNPIDRFVLAPLERDGIAPSPEADRATLIRRASLDLLGLPPTPAEVEAFVNDDRPDAYERLVDRLLASPHHGERWGRLWLDGARYADSNGYSIDAPRSIWTYRDWVIAALNRDMPFDQFTIEQIAGDLLPEATLAQKVATGFHRNTPINEEGGIDVEQFRVESVLDRVNTTAAVWLGLTMGCTQCHDHKFDPITQREYYQFFAFFNNVDEPVLPVATPDEVARRDAAEAQVAAYLKRILAEEPSLLETQRAWEDGLDMVARQKQSQEVRSAFDVVFARRTEAQQMTVFAAFIDQDPSVKAHRGAIDKIRARAPRVVTTMVVRERTTPRQTHVLIQGDFTRPGDVVTPGVPSVLPPIASARPNRLDLARWLVRPENPLTARVTVNRLWQAAFGRGLVETENDFGTQGAPPSHPELLDWLATEFMARGWSLKSIQRLIVTSASYRQASRLRPDLARIDPENRRLARQARVRLDAELVRDAALVAGGLLSPTIGGPSVFPPQPDGVMTLGQMRREWTTDAGADRYRRGLYTFFWRATPHPLLMVFDAPDATRACTRRIRSNTPLQALTLLNDEAFFEFARALAARVLREAPPDDAARLRHAFRLGLARAPSARELARLGDLLARQRAEFRADPDAARPLAAAAGAVTSNDVGERAAWTTVARVLLNLDEFITRE